MSPYCDDLTGTILHAVLINIRGGRFRGDSSLARYIYQIANNKIVEYFRRQPLRAGKRFYEEGKWDGALKSWKAGLRQAKTDRNLPDQAAYLNNMGLVYQAKGEWDKALEFYEKSLKTFERVGDIHGMAQTWGNMGILYKEMEEVKKAEEFLSKSFSILNELGARQEAEIVSRHLRELQGRRARKKKWWRKGHKGE